MFVIAGVGLVLSVTALAAFFGRYSWPLDLVANFRPQIGVVLLAAGVLLALGRWRRSARVVIAVGVLNLGLVGWMWVPASVDVGEDADELRVVSFNLLAANERYDDVMAFVERVDADVVFLHESSRPWEEAAEAAGLGYRVVKTRDEEHIFGTLVMVRGDAEVQSFGFTPREPRSVEVLLALDSGRRVAILGVHAVAPVTARDNGLRDAQLAFAANWAANQSMPTVVAGDLNSTPWSHSFRDLVAEGGLRDSQRGFGLQPSFPAASSIVFRIPIDHVLVSEEIAVADRRLGPPIGSDHYPLIVDLLVG
jgi:endonuclease/exonuclease/phosphatase (EEP) superfamily protein YafD